MDEKDTRLDELHGTTTTQNDSPAGKKKKLIRKKKVIKKKAKNNFLEDNEGGEDTNGSNGYHPMNSVSSIKIKLPKEEMKDDTIGKIFSIIQYRN